MDPSWPADADDIEGARHFLATSAGRVVVASHNDVDGLASAAIVIRALASRGIAVEALPSRRGEHVHEEAMRTRIRSLHPDALVVLDMGSRPDPILQDVPTLVIDHHDASGGSPHGALMVNGYDREPVAPTSVLTYVVCREMPGIQRSAWLAALGAIADLGTAAPFESLVGIEARGSAWSRAASLLNAGRRAPEDDALTALHVLEAAADVHDITAGRVPGVERLEGYRRAVHAEIARCSRAAPLMLGDAALIRFSSRAQVHPMLATRWSGRLAPSVVIAANEGFLPGRVNFALRSDSDVNLLEWLRNLPFRPSASAEYANGHPRATGGSLSVEDFDTFLDVLRARAGAATAGTSPSSARGVRGRSRTRAARSSAADD
jgi:single-stranded-DNA-specific exonuclease